MHLTVTAAPKPIINLTELAEVLAAVPEPIRRAAPLPVLESKLYNMAFDKPTLIEEVQAVYDAEARRRQQQPVKIGRASCRERVLLGV